MTLRGINVLELPINRFVNVVLAYLLRNATAENREKFLSELEMPPPGVEEPEEGYWSPEEMAGAFEQAMNAQI